VRAIGRPASSDRGLVKVCLVATGGTVASTGQQGALTATLTAEELLAPVRGRLSGVEVVGQDLTTVASYALRVDDLQALRAAIGHALDAGADGVVVTHGTDAMEETAFFLDLLHDDDRPVVLTGAQRAADAPGADGPANVLDALALAAAPEARGAGVLVVFDGVAFAARGVRKAHTLRAAAFGAPGRGPTHRVSPDGVHVLRRTDRPPALQLGPGAAVPRVDVISCHLGADGSLLRAAIDRGAAGIVVQAMGAGNAPPDVVGAVADAVAAGVPVVVCSRVGAGPVVPLYASGGGALAAGGAVFADDLSPWQARWLLALVLASGTDDVPTGVRRFLGG
jgi:L-asparaginase